MLQSIRSVASLLLSYGLLLLANGMFATLLGLRAKLEGFSTETVGFVMAGFFIGLLAGALYAVRVVSAVGHIRGFAAFASIMSVAVLGHVLLIDPFAWFFFRLAAGFCMAGMVMVVESWLNERATNETRGQILSIYMITNYLGSGMGQFMVSVADPGKFQLFVVASIVFSLALVPVLLTRASAPKPVTPQRMKFRDLYGISPLAVIGTISAGMVNSSINSMGPIFAKDSGLSLLGVSTFMACIIMGGMVLQFPIGRLSDRYDRRTILLIVTVTTVAAALAVIWATGQSPIWLYVVGAFFGAFCYTVYPLCVAQINDMAEPDKLVQVAAGLLFAYGAGASVGPIVAAQMMGKFGPEGMFMSSAALTGMLALFTAYRMLRRDRHDQAKVTFIPLGGTGVSSKQLYAAALKSILPSRKNKT
ncbi:MAG: MFS transporter [Rhodospirillaceae bacterium]|nr:MFS transporter [Rhodospirillaceae bacterium]MBT5242697.1 MFS transporter [Rhodospirillaceae bacterium]MBT5561510.1 MFS transporter [Rhodospirillaceae bacterium]MBT6241892.1 MFS transporter [Rhodospirillaceae bacterium]MBT7138693.1 MFS transporter [Rhodospirillaceae bacterium]